MSVYRISYRYANSLLLLAEEKNILKKVFDDADLIYNTLHDSKELRAVLKNPVLKLKEKKNLLSKIFEGKIGTETQSFMDFVIDKNREDILYEIFKEFLNLRDSKEGIIRAKVISVVELSNELKKKIEAKLSDRTGKKIKIEYSLDNSIVGGFLVKVDDTVIDSSVKHQLELLRKKFSEQIDPVLS